MAGKTMSKSKTRKSTTVSSKSSESGALRFLKIRHGDKRWLLAHTAIVAGTMGVAMVGAPSIAMADPGCVNTGVNLSGYEQFNCNGILDPGAATVVVVPSEDYQMFVDGTGDGEFIGDVNNAAVIHVDTQGEVFDGYIEIRDGAILDNSWGDGFVLESAGIAEVVNNGFIRGGDGEDGSVGFRAIGGGEIDLTNNSHIEGLDAGIYVDGASDVRLANHSYNSVMGGNGFELINSIGYVEVDNEAGLTAGLTEDGVHIDGVIDAFGLEDEAVAIYNGDSGIIVGNRNGVWINNVQEGAGEEADVLIDNEAFYDLDSEDYVEGGFIAGVTGDGVAVSDVFDDVEILNGGTRGVGINFSTITEDGIDSRVYSTSEDSVLLQPGGLFGVYSEDGLVPSRGIWGDQNGVNIVNVDDVRIHNTTDDMFTEDGPLGGLIVGANGAGIAVLGSEDVDIWNDAGLIWGGEDGISLYDSETASIWNADGTIMGYEGIGIDIGPSEIWFEDGRMAYDVEIYNASEEGPFNGGIIAGDEQAIRVAAQNIFIGNGTGGAILGNGFDDYSFGPGYGPAIIELYSSSENMFSGVVEVYNQGLIATWNTSEEGGEDGYLPHIDWYDELDFASTGSEEDDGLFLDLQAINSDIATYADFVWSGGADGSLFNDETETALSEYGTGATALAISSLGIYSEDFGYTPFGSGFSPGAGADVYNGTEGVIIGRIAMFGDSIYGDSEDFGYTGTSVRNEGVWYVKDYGDWGMMGPSSEDFSPAALIVGGPGGAEINNGGLIQSAFDSEEYETATFMVGNFLSMSEDIGDFNNGWMRGSFGGMYSEDYQQQAGLVSLVDGGVGDTFFLIGDFNGSEDIQDGTSFIALDVDFGSGELPDDIDWPTGARADMFAIYGEAWGHTGVIVNNLDPGATEMVGDVIQIGQAGYDDSYEYGEDYDTGAFYLAQQQPGYIEVDGVGAIQDGLYAWYLDTQLDGGEDGVGYYLVSAFGPQAVQLPSVVTAAQGVWYETASVVSDHVYGGHFPVAGGGGAGADLMVGETPMAVASAPETAIWGKISGSWTQQDTSVEQEVFPAPPLTIDTSFVQNTFSMLAGADFQPMGAGGPLRVGVFGGYVASSVDFDTYGASADLSGGTIGAYAAYTNGGFYVDGQAKVDLLSLNYSAPIGVDTDAAVTSFGVEANTGYRMDMGGLFIEPNATLSYVNTSIEDLSVGTASVDFSNGDSLRGGVGVTVGTIIDTGNDTTTELALLAKVWNEFEEANTVTISDGVGGSVEFADNISGVFGEVRGTATVTSLDQSLSGFVSAGSKFNDEFITVDAKVGVRKGF
jgi:outer membrane autotransporter protein